MYKSQCHLHAGSLSTCSQRRVSTENQSDYMSLI